VFPPRRKERRRRWIDGLNDNAADSTESKDYSSWYACSSIKPARGGQRDRALESPKSITTSYFPTFSHPGVRRTVVTLAQAACFSPLSPFPRTPSLLPTSPNQKCNLNSRLDASSARQLMVEVDRLVYGSKFSGGIAASSAKRSRSHPL